MIPGSTFSVDLMAGGDGGFSALSPDEQAAVLARIDRAPPVLREMLKSAVLHPVDLRTRFIERLPRVLFVLVPLFAGIVALFYRRRLSQRLVFALHLHTVIFLAIGVRQLSNFTRVRAISEAVGLGAALAATFAWAAMT